MSKRPRTLDGYFSTPPIKKARGVPGDDHQTAPIVKDAMAKEPEQDPKDQKSSLSPVTTTTEQSIHHTYPFPIPHLPHGLVEILNFSPAIEGRIINDQPDLDLVYYQPYIPQEIQQTIFDFLRRELFFYRVKYTIKRGEIETLIHTPRFTTVFGLDATSHFTPNGAIIDARNGHPVPKTAYKAPPRPIPHCLALLQRLTEASTGHTFNFALVNYYADGTDSISYHSDDERFLGPDPAIASFTLGATRDFLLRHKPTPAGHVSETTPRKFQLGPGDMLLMKGATQSQWLHSIPKRKGRSDEARWGRINITFRKAMVKGGTENYYRYNVGEGKEVYRWDERRKEMVLWS